MNTFDGGAELCRQLDMIDGGNRREEYFRECRQGAMRMLAELDAKLVSEIETTCDSCGGPIHVGDGIVTSPTESQPDAVLHRSCLFMGRKAAADGALARRLHEQRLQRERESVDPRQGRLFK